MTQINLNAEALYANLLHQCQTQLQALPNFQNTIGMIGIHSGGVWIAERLHRDLRLQVPLATLDSALYRDDLSARGFRTAVQPAHIPFEVADRHIILVDDVLYTGRTVRGALNELFDYGRPAKVDLAVLLDRGGRQLPVAAQYIGAVMPLSEQQSFILSRENDGVTLHVRLEENQ